MSDTFPQIIACHTPGCTHTMKRIGRLHQPARCCECQAIRSHLAEAGYTIEKIAPAMAYACAHGNDADDRLALAIGHILDAPGARMPVLAGTVQDLIDA